MPLRRVCESFTEPPFEYTKVLPDIANGLVADNVFLSGPIFPVNQLRSNRDEF